MARFFVGNVPYSATKEEILSALAEWEPRNLDMVKDKVTGRFRGYCFVDLKGFSLNDRREPVTVGIRRLHFGSAKHCG